MSIVEQIFATGEIRHARYTGFFKKIGETSVECAHAVLGNKLGTHLHSLCSILNLEHPDLDDVLPLNIMDAITQALAVAQFSEQNNFATVRNFLPKLLKSELKSYEDRLMSLRVAARLLQPKEREAARKTKKLQSIDLISVYKKDSSLWDNTPANFDLYVRNSNLSQEEMQKYERQAQRFKEMGCESMYLEIMKSVEAFRKFFNDTHYGFRRITMKQAALIVAKICGYSWNVIDNSKDVHGSLTINRDRLPSFDFPLAEDKYTYCPIAYPADQLSLMGENRKIIEYLENFPEAAGNPIFDYYITLIPSFAPLPSELCFLDLLNNESLFSVLLGEKDGKCYFICPWSHL